VARSDLSGWVEARALIKNDSKAMAAFLYEDVICRHGVLSSLGMKSKGVNKGMAKERLSKFYEATINSTLGNIKVGANTYAWFRRSH
jgi:hypothetical protein